MTDVSQSESPSTRPTPLPYRPAEDGGTARRACLALGWVGLAYAVARLTMASVYVLSRAGRFGVPDIYG